MGGTFTFADDIYHLSIDQIRAMTSNQLGVDAVKQAVQLNRARFDAFSQHVPARVYIGLRPWRIPVLTKTQQDHTGCLQLLGKGGAPGAAQGQALVVHTIEEAHLLGQSQERPILIAPLTDPAWTPLFLRVQGVVVESGGILSHSAIVA